MPDVPFRKIIVEQLEQLSSEREQLQYERNVPNVDITAELIWLWSSVAYHPADPKFTVSFSERELNALTDFNQTFEKNKPFLPASRGTVGTWLDDAHWREVMQAAASTLAVLGA